MNNENIPAVIETAIQNQKIDLNNINFLLPTETYGQVLGLYEKVIIEIVRVDPDPKNEEVYEIAKGKFALSQRPLMKISNAVGIVWDPKNTKLILDTDVKSRAKATGFMKKPNGEIISITEEKTIDLDVIREELKENYEAKAEKGDPDEIIKWEKTNSGKSYPVCAQWKSPAEKEHWINKMVRKALLQYRKFKNERVMTGAKERVIKKLLALKNTYTLEEIRKPFGFPRVVPDTSKLLEDPKMRQKAIKQMTGAAQSIFGKPSNIPAKELNPKYEVIKNNESRETEEEKKIKQMIEELKTLRNKYDKFLPADTKSIVDDFLSQKEQDPKTVSALIDKLNDWESKFLDKKKKGIATNAKTNQDDPHGGFPLFQR